MSVELQDDNARLRSACEDGLRRVFGTASLEAARTRLEHELQLVEDRGIAAQFLAIAGVVHRIREQRVLVGPGRGTASSSLVCYLLGITHVDPLAHELLFERFLPPEGDSIDVDIDVPDSRLDDVAGPPAKPGHSHSTVQLDGISMDVLGWRTLDQLTMTLRLVDADADPNGYFRNLVLDDEATFLELSSGQEHGIFQVESPGARAALRDVQPKTLDALATVVAMYRPGAFPVLHEYARRANDETVFKCAPEWRGILDSTYGLIVYQEQLMHLAMQLGGLSAIDANQLRRAFGRLETAVIADYRVCFLEGAATQGLNATFTEATWNAMQESANWAFCRSHAVAYAKLTYWDAYLQAHFPDERAAVRRQLVPGGSSDMTT